MTPWTVAYQYPQSMGFSRQEYWSGLPLGFSKGTEPIRYTIPIYLFILDNCLPLWWGLASLKSLGQASKLEIQVRVDVSVLSPKAGNTGGISYVAALGQNSFFFREFLSLFLRPSTDW